MAQPFTLIDRAKLPKLARLKSTMKDLANPVSIYWRLFPYLHPALRTIREQGPYSLLDVGCGQGKPVRFLRCPYKVGVDIDISALKHSLKERVYHDVILGDARYLPFRDRSFDSIPCLQVLHLLNKEDTLKAMNEIKRVAKRSV